MSLCVAVAAREMFLGVNSWGGAILCAGFRGTACVYIQPAFSSYLRGSDQIDLVLKDSVSVDLKQCSCIYGVNICPWTGATGEKVISAVSLVCVEYFWRAKKGFKETNEQECVYLAFAPQVPYGLSCLLSESHQNYLFFCLYGQLEARIWLNKRRILELLSEKWEETTCLFEHCCD